MFKEVAATALIVSYLIAWMAKRIGLLLRFFKYLARRLLQKLHGVGTNCRPQCDRKIGSLPANPGGHNASDSRSSFFSTRF